MIPTTHVRSPVLFLVGGILLALTGCSNPARDRMVGEWEASFEMSDDDMAQVPPDNAVVAEIGKLLMKSVQAEMGWEFAADGTAIASATLLGNAVIRRGTWQFASGDETSTTITVQFEEEEPRELKFTFADPDTIEVGPFSTGKWQLARVVKFKRVVAAR